MVKYNDQFQKNGQIGFAQKDNGKSTLDLNEGLYSGCPATWITKIKDKAGLTDADIPHIYCTAAKIDQEIIKSKLEFQVIKCGSKLTKLTNCNDASTIESFFSDKIFSTGVVS